MHNIIITGGAGFIGHHLVKKLTETGLEVTIVDNLSNSNKDFMRKFEVNRSRHNSVSIYNADIRTTNVISDIFESGDFDTCVHLAAKVGVQDSILRPHETIDVNVKGTLNMLEICSKYNVQNFVFASSAAVYGYPRKLPLPEDLVAQPISPYGASKLAAEALLSSYRSKIKNCASLRFFNVYGEGQTSDYAGVISRFIGRLHKDLPPLIYGNGRQTRDFISVSDVVNAIILASENEGKYATSEHINNTFNIGTGKATSILDLALMMIDIFNLKSDVKPIHLEYLEGDILQSYPDIDRATNVLNFIAQQDLKSGLINLIKQDKKG
jgi:UDP-glucose 4-epimerase